MAEVGRACTCLALARYQSRCFELFLEHVSLVTLPRATHYVLLKSPLVLLGIEPSKKRHTSAMLSCVQAGAGRQARSDGRLGERSESGVMRTDERIRHG